MPRTMLPLPPLPAISPLSSPPRCFLPGCDGFAHPKRRACIDHLTLEPTGGEILVPCSTPSCAAFVSVLLGDCTPEEAAVDALCFGCVLELMAGRWGPAA